jgi:hypothetical protein
MSVGMSVLVWMLISMRMSMSVRMPVLIACMGMRVVMVGVCVGISGGGVCLTAVHHYLCFHGTDARAVYVAKLQFGTQVKRRSHTLEQAAIHAGGHQSPQKHVTADAGETFDISNADGVRRSAHS